MGFPVIFINIFVFSFRESYVNVEVTLLDANDNNPMFVPSNLYEFTVSNRAQVGSIVGKVFYQTLGVTLYFKFSRNASDAFIMKEGCNIYNYDY